MSSTRFLTGAACAVLTVSLATTALPARADDAGAFVGGMLAGRVMRNMHERTEAEKQQAYYAQQQAQAAQAQQAQPAQAAPAQKTRNSSSWSCSFTKSRTKSWYRPAAANMPLRMIRTASCLLLVASKTSTVATGSSPADASPTSSRNVAEWWPLGMSAV